MSETKPRVKIFFVTYQDSHLLNATLNSFFNTGGGEFCDDVNIINNHSNFQLNQEFTDRVNVIHNNTRPDFSTGHLSRNWNQSIIHGFKDLNNPDCDILITSQNDVDFIDNWTETLLDIHLNKGIQFITNGPGDCFCSYTPDAIKKVGIWDERYCGLGYQEADYFLRSIYHLGEYCSINDFVHGRSFNAIGTNMCDKNYELNPKMTEHHVISMNIGHQPSMQVFKMKFAGNLDFGGVNTVVNFKSNGTSLYSGNLKTSMLYPYFENNIPNRHELNYMN